MIRVKTDLSLDSWLKCLACGPELDVEEVEVIRGLIIEIIQIGEEEGNNQYLDRVRVVVKVCMIMMQ